MTSSLSNFDTFSSLASGSHSLAPVFANSFAAITSSFEFFNTFAQSDLVLWIKLLSLLCTGILTICLIFLTLRVHATLYPESLRPLAPGGVAPAPAPKRNYDIEWSQIRNFAVSASPAEWKLAVIEGDKIMDDALKTSGFPGETMGERLTLITPDNLPSVQSIWDAHKLRNLLVHDIRFTINQTQAINAVANFERGLRNLEMLS